jgi:hypothetical protein
MELWEGSALAATKIARLGVTALLKEIVKRRYFAAEKRLSNELDDTIGWAPATSVSLAGVGAASADTSESEGFIAGRAAATCLGSCFTSTGLVAAVFGVQASGRGGSLRLASAIFGLAGAAEAVLAVVSEAAPSPTLRTRSAKKPPDCLLLLDAEPDDGVLAATRLGAGGGAGAVQVAAGVAAASSAPGSRGGLTVDGIVPGAGVKPASAKP